jgi:hypothetical protein
LGVRPTDKGSKRFAKSSPLVKPVYLLVITSKNRRALNRIS